MKFQAGCCVTAWLAALILAGCATRPDPIPLRQSPDLRTALAGVERILISGKGGADVGKPIVMKLKRAGYTVVAQTGQSYDLENTERLVDLLVEKADRK